MIFLKFNSRDDNYGDQLIFECLYRELLRYDDVCFLANAPQFLNVEPIRFREAFIVALKLKLFKAKSSVVLDPPGARFIPRVPLVLSRKERLKRWCIHKAWKVIGAKFIVAGISVDPSDNPKEYARYDSVGVRDNTTYKLLRHTHADVSICPDMACLREPQLKIGSLENAKTIVSLREKTPDDGYSDEYASVLEVSLSEILNTVIHDFSFYAQVDEDANFNRRLADTYSVAIKPGVPEHFNYGEFLKDYGIVLSNRLHVLLPAMTEGLLPIVLISKQHIKLRSLFETNGWGDCIIFTDQPGDITERVQQIVRQADCIRQRNYVSLVKLRNEAQVYIRNMVISTSSVSMKSR